MPDIVIDTVIGETHVTAFGVRSDTSSRGLDLAGAIVTARFADGSSEILTWEAFDAFTFGGATGAGVEMSFGFDSHDLTATNRLASLTFDLAPAHSVFDITLAMDDDPSGTSTLTSKNGFPFDVSDQDSTLPGSINVTYSNAVSLAGAAPVGDLFTTMEIDFSGLSGGGLLGDLRWNSDIDTLGTVGDLHVLDPALIGDAAQNMLTGGSGADVLIGLDGVDVLNGGGGDDYLVGGKGQDVLRGGEGFDTAAYAGALSEMTLTLSPDHAPLLEHRVADGEGRDALSGVELLAFAEGETINLDKIDGVATLNAADMAILIEVYIAYFNRAPDALGLYFWGNALADGVSLDQIAALFLDQDETRETYPAGQPNEAFVTQVYNNVLGRDPDTDGFEFWRDELNSGRTSRDVYILRVLEGAKAAPDPGQTQEFIDLQLADRAYLAAKTDIGGHYAAVQGLSDVAAAKAVMDSYERGQSDTLAAAISLADATYAEASDAEDGQMLLPLIGVIDSPFD